MVHTRLIARFHQNLHRWYAVNGRCDLPWRNTADAYAIYISEVMLQQTQVKTVLERFYSPFLERFPTLEALADAPRDAVMKAWEGLGYYSRAANLHSAAQQAKPALPKDVEGLQALPGIGRNTAHAIAAFAYHHPVPVMEANVKRVLCRIFAIKSPKTEELWEKAFVLLDKEEPFDYNQAMMDIGAMVCTKRTPKCGICPAEVICEGKADPEAYPEALKKKPVPIRRANALVFQDSHGRIMLAKREGAFLNGLYGFPLSAEDIEVVYIENKSVKLNEDALLIGEESQVYSHFRSDVAIHLVRIDFRGASDDWFLPSQLGSLALSGIDHKIWAKTLAFFNKL